MAIQGVEGLDLFAILAVKQCAIGENAINIEQHDTDLAGTSGRIGSGAHRVTARAGVSAGGCWRSIARVTEKDCLCIADFLELREVGWTVCIEFLPGIDAISG